MSDAGRPGVQQTSDRGVRGGLIIGLSSPPQPRHPERKGATATTQISQFSTVCIYVKYGFCVRGWNSTVYEGGELLYGLGVVLRKYAQIFTFPVNNSQHRWYICRCLVLVPLSEM